MSVGHLSLILSATPSQVLEGSQDIAMEDSAPYSAWWAARAQAWQFLLSSSKGWEIPWSDCQQALQMVTQFCGNFTLKLWAQLPGPFSFAEEAWRKAPATLSPDQAMLTSCPLCKCMEPLAFLVMLPYLNLFYLPSSTIPVPWVNRTLFVGCKEIKLQVAVLIY